MISGKGVEISLLGMTSLLLGQGLENKAVSIEERGRTESGLKVPDCRKKSLNLSYVSTQMDTYNAALLEATAVFVNAPSRPHRDNNNCFTGEKEEGCSLVLGNLTGALG